MPKAAPHVVNIAEVDEIRYLKGKHWGGYYRPLTPALDRLGGRLGVSINRVPPGRSMCPFHSHQREDEVFYVLSGRGLLRYGDAVREIGAGDCVSCPAGSGNAHQLGNPFGEDLVYLGIGPNDPHEVCLYPDSGKVMVRSLKTVGILKKADYYAGEAAEPKILAMAARASRKRGKR
jgi:uncharacterized cupin superfamily protein